MTAGESTTLAAAGAYIPFPRTGSYPVRRGNLVRPLIDGEPAFRRICEVVEATQYSVWLTVTFYAPDLQMPDGRGTLFDVLDQAAAKGLDVRVIFWRPNLETSRYARTFPGAPADHEILRTRNAKFLIRWDRACGGFCQHQKIWLIDAGHPSETAFVGGINLTAAAMGSPSGQRYDLDVEVAGPGGSDVHHNFVQRWNEASERKDAGGVWGHDGDDTLVFPTCLSCPRGDSLVQVQRTVHAD